MPRIISVPLCTLHSTTFLGSKCYLQKLCLDFDAFFCYIYLGGPVYERNSQALVFHAENSKTIIDDKTYSDFCDRHKLISFKQSSVHNV